MSGKFLTISDRDRLDLSYSKLVLLSDYNERLNYLSLWKYGYNSPRGIGQFLYQTKEWKRVREEIIFRDLGYDLGIPGINIQGRVLVHHIKPILEEDIEHWNVDILFNPDNLITVSDDTHNKIHYKEIINYAYTERSPGDTKLW